MPKNATSSAFAEFDNLPDSALVDVRVYARLLGCSENTVWRRAKDGVIPRPTRVSPQQTRWRVGDVRKYLASLSNSDDSAAKIGAGQ